jgi:metal-sulfur cluster biosynthetic enzyme
LEGRDAEVREVEMAAVRTADVMEALASVYDPCCQENQISERVAALPGMAGSTVEVVWDEPWTTERLSDRARSALRFLPHPKEVGP